MNKHEEARIKLNHGMEFGLTYKDLEFVLNVLIEAEATEKELEELKKYRQLVIHDEHYNDNKIIILYSGWSYTKDDVLQILKNKLSKVGKEE